MNLVNIIEHIPDLIQLEFSYESKTITASDEIFAWQTLFEIQLLE